MPRKSDSTILINVSSNFELNLHPCFNPETDRNLMVTQESKKKEKVPQKRTLEMHLVENLETLERFL